MTNFTYDENIYSDLYKEVFGSRPREAMNAWNQMTPEEKQVEWDQLCDWHEEELDRENKEKAQRRLDLANRIQETVALGADDVKTALKWIMEAEEFDEFDLQYGADYFCYYFGLDYSVRTELPIQEAIYEVMKGEIT